MASRAFFICHCLRNFLVFLLAKRMNHYLLANFFNKIVVKCLQIGILSL